MAPTRVGLIGLSSTNTAYRGPGGWGVATHLPSILKHPDFQLVAIANSSVEAAHRAIKLHQLPASIKTYGTPEAIAQDPDVDMVVVSVNVATHYALAKPALLAKKDVYVEWPLGANTAEAEELTQLAKENGVKTSMGIQARADPLVIKIKKMIDAGEIGEVTSSTVNATFGMVPNDVWFAGAEYYLDINSGGNTFSIYFGHFIDSFTHVLGGFDTIQSTLHTHHPTIKVPDANGKIINDNHPKTTPDHIALHGFLSSGAFASITFRSSQGAVNNHDLVWIISGTKGEIQVEGSETWQLDNRKSKLWIRRGKGETELVDFKSEGFSDLDVPYPAGNITRTYQAIAANETSQFANFEEALQTHKLLDRIRAAAGK